MTTTTTHSPVLSRTTPEIRRKRSNAKAPTAKEVLTELHGLLEARGTTLAQEINTCMQQGAKMNAAMIGLILRTHLEVEKVKMEQDILSKTIPQRFVTNPEAISKIKAKYQREEEDRGATIQ